MLKKIRLDEAIGMVLGHDVTKIIPGRFKGPAFRRGHIIRKEDIPELLSIGKEHVYVIQPQEGEVHEEEAALRIAKAVSSPSLELTEPREGRVNVKAGFSGLLKISIPLLEEINSIGDIILATLHNNTVCRQGVLVAGTRITPLYITETKIKMVEELCQRRGKVLEIIPFKTKRVGMVIVGNEVFSGRIRDKFGEVIPKKFEALGSTISFKTIVPDDVDLIAQAIKEAISKGCEVIVACGGMSIDPDDVTVKGIEGVGAKIVSYGAPVLPGSMFLYAKWETTSILGAPACVIHDPTTILDLLLPRILAGEDISRQDIIQLGHGGLCLNCNKCSFPICPFGK